MPFRALPSVASAALVSRLRGPLLTLLVALLAALTAFATPAPVRAAPDDTEVAQAPLEMHLDQVSPIDLDGDTPIRLSGTVTNLDDTVYRDVGIYPVLGDGLIRSEASLREQTVLPTSAYVGDRILTEGSYTTVDRMAPGETVSWSLRIDPAEFPSSDGVVWLGAHALIPEGGDIAIADGRVRTFIPRVTDAVEENTPEPPESEGSSGQTGQGNRSDSGPHRQTEPETDPAQVAMVIPLRRRVVRSSDGRIDNPAQWSRTLSDGRLSRLLDVGEQSSRLTWLIDPAVLDAIDQLARGNPERQLDPTIGTEDDPEEGGDGQGDDGSAEASPSPSASPEAPTSEPPDEETAEAQKAAQAWLERLPAALADHQVLGLPYADPDLAALAEHDRDLYATARTHGRQTMRDLGVASEPAVAPASGYLPPSALRMLSDDPLVLVSQEAYAGRAPATAEMLGHTVLTTSSTANAGGPAPAPAHSPVAARQQAVSVAGLHYIDAVSAGEDPDPVVAMLPDTWRPTSATRDVFAELDDREWLESASVGDVLTGRSPATLPATRLRDPRSERRFQIDAERFEAAHALIRHGKALERLLTRNDQVAGEVTEEALTSLSYAARPGGRVAADQSRHALAALLSSVSVEGPTGVMLSGSQGGFAATIVNELDQPVTVTLKATSDSGISVTVPDMPVDLPADGRSSIRMEADAVVAGVHEIELTLVNIEDTPVGTGDTVPLRTGQVSVVIWWFIGVGCALLFGAIALRLVRRIRRRSDPAAVTDDEEPA